MTELDERIADLAARDRSLATSILAEAIRVPADWVDRSADEGGDPRCGMSNHEQPRLEYLREQILGIGAVRSAEDVSFDDYGNLVWSIEDPADGIPSDQKKVIWFDGHTDTVNALRESWRQKIDGVDAYDGMVDATTADWAFLGSELGYLPPEAEREHLLFGRGSADQLGGVVAQIVATRIMLELAPAGALAGVIVRSYATVTEEDNDGGGPAHALRAVSPELLPDVVVLTEGTGDSDKGALGIYRGQRGRMQIEVEITGRSCHGSMPWEGLNPLEYGGAIVTEAARRYDARDGFLDHEFLGHGTRTASWAELQTPSDCAVPERFTLRFDRRLTIGETPDRALADVASLAAVQSAREAGLSVDVRVPVYQEPTWRGYRLDNPQIYMGWLTPEEHPAIAAAVDTYQRVVTPRIESEETDGARRRHPRVDRWIFSTDGVGYPVRGGAIAVPERKAWVQSGEFRHPAMLGFGPGIEQNTHKVGECVDTRELEHAIAFLARFPSVFAGER